MGAIHRSSRHKCFKCSGATVDANATLVGASIAQVQWSTLVGCCLRVWSGVRSDGTVTSGCSSETRGEMEKSGFAIERNRREEKERV